MNNYPQAPPMSEEEVAAFLATAPLLRLASHNPDGTIHLTPTWFLYDNGRLLIGTQRISRKARNIAADARVTAVADTHEPAIKGVIIYGSAGLDSDDVIAQRTAIFAKYMMPKRATAAVGVF